MGRQNGTAKDGVPYSGPLDMNSFNGVTTGDKRPRGPDSESGPTFETWITFGYPEPVSIFDHRTGQEMRPMQESSKRPRTASFVPINNPAQSVLEGDQTPTIHNLIRESIRRPPRRSPSPTIRENETELRCDLTSEINIQREKHRNLTSNCLHKIRKLLKRAKLERPEKPNPEDPLMADEWLDEDELMEISTTKLEKGGRCSRALLSRLEYFLYGPLMSPEEKRNQERTICVEECVSTSKTAANYNFLLLNRLVRIVDDPAAYGLHEKHADIKSLRSTLIAAISEKTALNPSTMRKFAQLLDPEGVIANPVQQSPIPKVGSTEDPKSATGKVPAMSAPAPFAPSSEPASPSKTKCQPSHPSLLSPTKPTLPPLSPLHPSSLNLQPSASTLQTTSSLVASDISTADLTTDLSDDEMRPLTRDEKTCLRPTERTLQVQRRLAAEASAANPSSSRRASSSGTPHVSAGIPSSNNRASTSNLVPVANLTPSATATSIKRPASNGELMSSDIPKQLLNIFLTEIAPLLPILKIDKLKVAFSLAISHGPIDYQSVDPTAGLCLAIASLITRKRELWNSRKWYDAAQNKIDAHMNAVKTIEYFQNRILQIRYLQMTGELQDAWVVTSLGIGQAQSLGIHLPHCGRLAEDKNSRHQLRMIWQALSMAKLSLALQLGFVDLPLETSDNNRMPSYSRMEENMGSSLGGQERAYATSAFFVTSASIVRYTELVVDLENDFRVNRPECPFEWVRTVDLRDLVEFDVKLLDWKKALPKCLQWHGPGIESLVENDAVIRRMCALLHLKYIYFRLRQHRPFLVLNMRLSYMCSCQPNPHMSAKEMYLPDMPIVLQNVRAGVVQCLSAAQDIIKSLWVPSGNGIDDHLQGFSSSERVDYLYTAVLVLLAARMFTFIVKDGLATSVSTLTDQIRQADVMLRNCEEVCEQCPALGQRIRRARAFLDLVSRQSISLGNDDRPGFVSDGDLNILRSIWVSLYDRLNVKLESPVGLSSVGTRMLFCWMETLPIDFDD